MQKADEDYRVGDADDAKSLECSLPRVHGRHRGAKSAKRLSHVKTCHVYAYGE